MYPLYMGELLLQQEFSLVPVRGVKDSSAPKAAALDWKIFQHKRASLGEVAQWTQINGWELAIATGRVSGFVVIDFDSFELWQRFSIENPHLVRDKVIVRTKRGIHLYIPVARAGEPLSSFHKEEWGFSGDGRYVVAPGAIIDGHTYTIIAGSLDKMPAPTPGQLKEILAWLQPDGAPAPIAAADRPAQLILPEMGPARADLIQAMKQRFHSQIVASGGRNNAAFNTLTWGRDRGLTMDNCMALLPDFLSAPGANQSERSRIREFQATLRSAFSRPARPVGAGPVRLPDSVRQALSRLKQTHIWRLLDLLFSAGIRPGQTITRKIALQLCGEQLGERNVWRALSDKRYFPLIKGKGSLLLSPNTYGVEPGREGESSEIRGEKCNYSRYQKLQLNTHCNRGRPPHLYSIPTIDDVCRIVNVKTPRWSSPIEHSSSKEARLKSYEAKIKHKPGTYANAVRAGWFGVCVNTIKAYDKALKIVRREQLQEAPLSLWNVESLPAPAMGYWLTCNGKRYPTVPALASKLMKSGRVSLVKQLPNYICTSEHLQQQKQLAIARTRTAAGPAVQPTIVPTIAAKTPQKAVQMPALEQKPYKSHSTFKAPMEYPPAAVVESLDNGYPDDAMRDLKRQWAMLAGVGISSTTTKSDRLELVQRVMPGADEHMSDRDYGYLLDTTPRRMLMWLRKRVGDPLYTRDDVKKIHRLMGGELTRKRAVELFKTYGRAKTLRCAEFVSSKQGIDNRPAYLITCLRADQRMSALMSRGRI